MEDKEQVVSNKEEVKVDNYFVVLNNIDVSKKTEKKNGLTYLSWAWAWGETKKIHPEANYKIYEREDGCFYWTDGKTCWVKTGVIVNGIEHIEYLPVMDYKNKSIALAQVTSFDVNKSIQRSLTKALARHGLGLYIYAGEDLPNQVDNGKEEDNEPLEEESVDEELYQKCLNYLTKLLSAEQNVEYKNAFLAQRKLKSVDELSKIKKSELIEITKEIKKSLQNA